MDIYSFGVNVACGGFLKSQKARLLTARQIFLLFVLLVSHTVASSSLVNLLLLPLGRPDLYHMKGEDKTLQFLFFRSLFSGSSAVSLFY